jgi:ATP-binding cassette, subfamily B, bacterial
VFSSFWPRRSVIHRPESTWLAILFGILAGLLLPLLVLLLGWTVELLLHGREEKMPQQLLVGPFAMETDWLNAGSNALRGTLGLVVLLAIATLMKSIAVVINERSASHASLDFDVQVQKLLFTKSGSLATQHGLSGQRSVLHDIQTASIPKVRDAIFAWYVAFPRYLLHVILLLLLAGAIHPWLTATAVVALLALRSAYFAMESSRRKHRPVHLERWRSASEQLAYFCDTAPLLATIHDAEDTASSYRSHLQNYRQAGMQLMDFGGWRSPILRWFGILLMTGFAMLIAVRVLDPQAPVGLGAIVSLCVAVFLAVVAFTRAGAAVAARRRAETSVQQIVNYLSQGESSDGRTDLKTPTRVAKELMLDHLTIRESSGKKLLEDLSLTLRPGELTAIVGTESVQTRALAELILGFGKPTSGRMLIDGVDSIDISRDAFQKLSFWVAPNGPLVSGSIGDNLWIEGHPDATVDLMEVARRARVADAILNLPEGLQTLVSPAEDRLQPDALFRLGIARGFVKKPSIVVAEEPRPAARASIENDTTEALLELKSDGIIVVVLPSRITTLRAADQVIVVHEHRIAHVGTHNELLETSELYRHLNYLRYSHLGV